MWLLGLPASASRCHSSTGPQPGPRMGYKSLAWRGKGDRALPGAGAHPHPGDVAPSTPQTLSGNAPCLQAEKYIWYKALPEGGSAQRSQKQMGSCGGQTGPTLNQCLPWGARGSLNAAGQVQAPGLTLVSQRQSTVEVSLLHHPRGIVGLVGHPAGTHAGHPDGCKAGGWHESRQPQAWAPPCPHHRDSGRARSTKGRWASDGPTNGLCPAEDTSVHSTFGGSPREPG